MNRSNEAGRENELSLADKYPPGTTIVAIDGHDFKLLIRAAYAWLEQHHDIVNALNVFPVPDGDTGTNMLLTMQSAWQEIEQLEESAISPVAQAVSHGALMGARGNSGVILSQILRGFSRRLDDAHLCDAQTFVEALQEGTETAYKGVVKPVEGTILTVIREATAAARLAAAMDDDLRFIIGRAVHAADEAVQKTPELLPVLAQAGVVDSGGKGLFFLLEGMYRCLRGELVTPVREAAPAFAGRPEAVVGEYGFDVQFIIQGADLDVDQIRRDITQMGDSVLVVGDSRTVRVHVHSPEPGTPLNYGARLGYMSHIIVENMQAQYEKFVHGVGDGNGPVDHEVTLAPSTVVEDEAVAGQISVVAVVPGEGLQRVFKSLGADVIVSGGQTMNPSTEELLKAIESVQNNQVLVLPNNSNVIMAAQQAQQLSEKQVRVVPSKTIPQGISALLSMNHQADLDRNVELMRAALADVETGEVTTAVRAARFDGIEVQEGDVIGLHNDVLSAKGNTPEDVACTLLEQMHADEAEIITIYYGDSVSAGQAQALADELQELYPHQEVEVVEGGQPHYHYILSVE